eukprot:3631-Heterococcus_DN1.PRE.1
MKLAANDDADSIEQAASKATRIGSVTKRPADVIALAVCPCTRLGAVALGAIGPCTALFNFVFATASCVLM